MLLFAAAAALAIAMVGALCSYDEKYLTTSVGQWVMHDLRQDALLAHAAAVAGVITIKQETGDLISRVTSDIDSDPELHHFRPAGAR